MNKPMRLLSRHRTELGDLNLRGHDPMQGHVFGGDDLRRLTPEEAARYHLDFLVVDGGLWMEPMEGEDEVEFVRISVRQWPESGTLSFRYRQTLHGIPVYRSAVTIEMDRQNNFVALDGAVAPSIDLSPEPALEPQDAFRVAHRMPANAPLTDDQAAAACALQLYYYEHESGERRGSEGQSGEATRDEQNAWCLVYMVRNVNASDDGNLDAELMIPETCDCLVDANTGEVISEIPSGPDEAHDRWGPTGDGSTEEQGNPGTIDVPPTDSGSNSGAARAIQEGVPDDEGMLFAMPPEDGFAVRLYDFDYRNFINEADWLPGDCVTPPPPSDFENAYRNLLEVSAYLTNVLGHPGLDGNGMDIVSSVRCVCGPGAPEWRNSAWIGHRCQVVFGQLRVGATLKSFADARDIVAHEVFHGVTHHTAKLDYVGQSGALNESYSDIFAVLVLNAGRADIGAWEWEIGKALGGPMRSMKEPGRYGYTVQGVHYPQPDHMDNYVHLLPARATDRGGVHVNSGIHNKAAYTILTSRDRHGRFLFEPELVAGIFYKALVDGIYEHATFSESRARVENAARTLLLRDFQGEAKLAAIERAFDAVGIVPLALG